MIEDRIGIWVILDLLGLEYIKSLLPPLLFGFIPTPIPVLIRDLGQNQQIGGKDFFLYANRIGSIKRETAMAIERLVRWNSIRNLGRL